MSEFHLFLVIHFSNVYIGYFSIQLSAFREIALRSLDLIYWRLFSYETENFGDQWRKKLGCYQNLTVETLNDFSINMIKQNLMHKI